jgi:hypothetical protein
MSPSHRRMAIVALALTAFWPTLRMGFLWDDHVMIEINPTLRSWSIPHLKHDILSDAFDGHGDPYYRPLQTLANRLDYSVWRLNPFGFHLTNLIFHAGSSVLIGELVVALGLGPLAALLAGCLFAVHPIGVEQLMIIAGRAELMSLFFALASLLFFLQSGSLCLFAGSAAYGFALLSKESGIMTPALWLLVLWFLKDKRTLASRLWIYAGLTFLYLFLRHIAIGAQTPSVSLPYALRFLTTAFPKVLAIYARLILVPWNLHSHRMVPHLSHVWPLYIAGWLAVTAWLIHKNNRIGLFGLAWFFVTLLPKTPAMFLGNFILDHWAYPAALGVILPIAVGLARLWEARQVRWKERCALAFFPLLLFWALLTRLNIELRGSDEKMY